VRARRAGATNRAQPARQGWGPAYRDVADGLHRGRLRNAAAHRRQRTVRNRPVHDGRDASNGRRPAGVASGQPGDLHADRHATEHRGDASAGEGNLRVETSNRKAHLPGRDGLEVAAYLSHHP
jgi:hypothetical protein